MSGLDARLAVRTRLAFHEGQARQYLCDLGGATVQQTKAHSAARRSLRQSRAALWGGR